LSPTAIAPLTSAVATTTTTTAVYVIISMNVVRHLDIQPEP